LYTSEMQHAEKSGLWFETAWSEQVVGGEWPVYRWSSGSRRLYCDETRR